MSRLVRWVGRFMDNVQPPSPRDGGDRDPTDARPHAYRPESPATLPPPGPATGDPMITLNPLDHIRIDGPWPITYAYDPDTRTISMTVERIDTITGEPGSATMRSRPFTTGVSIDESTAVRTAYSLYASFCEHEAREAFKYLGRRVFGPHISVRALHEAAASTEG